MAPFQQLARELAGRTTEKHMPSSVNALESEA